VGTWIVLYDADCGFCTWTLAWLLRLDRRRRFAPLPLGTPRADALLADLDPAARAESWHLVAPDGRRASAGAALPEALALLPAGRAPAAALRRAPGLTERGYRWVAANRSTLGRFVTEGARRRARRLVAAHH
jgi:predicted DCC family thiol-disulfide oxidoreductase YuxK